MNISGSARIPAGDYSDEINVSGSAKIDGTVRCLSFHCSGSVGGDGALQCKGEVKISGAVKIGKGVEAKSVVISGALKAGGGCTVEEEIRLSGALVCEGDLRCTTLRASGGIRVGGGIEAEEVKISGNVTCAGLLNAETVDIRLENNSNSRIGSIGGGTIKVSARNNKGASLSRLPLLSKLMGAAADGLQVDEIIEGDIVAVERVSVPTIVGRVVAIGAGCTVGVVQYSESVEIHPDAKVDKCEKTE